jgi:DNA-binding IclR family transcriptional regulator
MNDVDADPDRYRAPALDKGLDIIELLAATPVGLTQGEIARQLQRTSSEIFRMLFVLRQRGYVAQADDDRYVLTTKLFKVADRHSPIRRLTAVAGQVMQTLANQINQSIHMSILQSGRLLVAALVDPPRITF